MSRMMPAMALSIRQPWTWACIYGGKDIENRDWNDRNPGLRFRGRVALHASKGMSRQEYVFARDFMESIGVACPAPADLMRGGIIGTVEIVQPLSFSMSDWFFGPVGLKLRDPKPCEFIPVKGGLGFFYWKPAGPEIVPEPARWMKEFVAPGKGRDD